MAASMKMAAFWDGTISQKAVVFKIHISYTAIIFSVANVIFDTN
jgi:hypothetical protein